VDHNLFGPKTMTAGLLRKELLARKVFLSPQNAVVEWPSLPGEMRAVKELVEDSNAMSDFIREHRHWLGIPMNVPIDPGENCQWIYPISPPMSRISFDSTEFRDNPQAVLKIFWTTMDDEEVGNKQLTIRAGTTVIFDMNTGQIIGRLICAPPTKSMFVSELVQVAYENEYQEHRKKIRSDLALELKAAADELGAVPENIDRGTHTISIQDGVIRVIGQGISDIRDE
jgi:hypothetical protein